MNNCECSLLIHSRTKYCDFRNDFLVRPNDFEESQTKKYKKMILQTTTSIEELINSDKCRKIVISDDMHIVCGVTAYMKFFADYNENLKQVLQDEYGRSIYLFVGIVIKKSYIMNDVFFPSDEALARFLETYLIPRWNDYKYDDKSRQSTLVPYSETAIGVDAPSTDGGIQINCSNTQMKIFPANQADNLLKKILSVVKVAETSACINFSYKEDADNSDFLNVTIGNNNSSTMIKRFPVRPSSVNYYNSRVENANNLYRQNQEHMSLSKQPSKEPYSSKKNYGVYIDLSSKDVKYSVKEKEKRKYMIVFDLDVTDEEAERTLTEIKKYLDKNKKIKHTQVLLFQDSNNV